MARREVSWGKWIAALTIGVVGAAFGARPPVPQRSPRPAAGGRAVSRAMRGRTEEHDARVSVVIPAYRAAHTIGRAVQSVLDQSVPVHEILVIDDGSPDDVAAAVAAFGPRVTVLRKPNGGVSSARNLGIARATGDYLAFLDADDYWEPDKLARQLDVLAAHPDVGMVGSALWLEEPGATRRIDPAIDRALFDRRLELDGPDAFRAAGMFWTGTVVLRRDVLGDDRFDEALSTAEDRELWLRMLLRAPAWLAAAPTATCVLEPGSLSRGDVDRDCVNMLALVDRHHALLGDAAYARWRSDLHRRWSARLLAEGRGPDALIPALVSLRYGPTLRAAWTVVRSVTAPERKQLAAPAPAPAVAVDVVDHDLDALAGEWTALHARGDAPAYATTWPWMAAWWDVFGEGRALRVLTARDGGRLIGVLPLVEHVVSVRGVPVRRLGFLGTGEDERDEVLSEYVDAIVEPGREREVSAAWWRALAAEPSWDELRLASIRHGARTRATLRDAAAAPDRVVQERRRPDAVLVRLADAPSKKLREDLRRHRRLLERTGEVRLIRATSLEELRAMWPTFVHLHQALWRSRGKPGCFASARFARFHAQVAERLWPSGAVQLHVLTAGDRPVAARYGFQLGARMYEYQSGLDPGVDGRISTGLVSLHACMDDARARGATTYDLGEGTRPYKLRWPHALQPTYDLRIARRNARTTIADALDAGAARLRDARRALAAAGTTDDPGQD